jgi:DNA repair protein RecN (Recombination protein N)
MLTSLLVRDIVLIRRLELTFREGFCVLTGETGAGKSIILDALGLAMGGRAERSLVRRGAEHGSVTARFEPPPDHLSWAILADQAIPADGELVLRRIVGADGRTRAFVNDEAVSTQLLRRLGDSLIEVHGQNDQRGLLNSTLHREVLDAFAALGPLVEKVAAAHADWREAVERADRERAAIEAARREEDYLRHRAAELEELAPVAGEEEQLAERRQLLMNREKLAAALEEATAAMGGSGGARERLVQAERRLARARPMAEELLEPAAAALDRALVELDEAEAALEVAARALDLEAGALEEVETRLFALRDMARKHRVDPDELVRLLAETHAALAAIDSGAEALQDLDRRAQEARAGFEAAARELGGRRAEAADRLAAAVGAELPPLKLDRARFRVAIQPLPEAEWGPAGGERVAFEVATNPGQPFGPLARIASGGELSRFMLALKVVLARVGAAGTLIFDEIDAGIGGAVADAVGERLARLAEERQVLVVTHSAQVAAQADDHLTVTKLMGEGTTEVEVRPLPAVEREGEIARMLAGAEVTGSARAAAASLLERARRR